MNSNDKTNKNDIPVLNAIDRKIDDFFNKMLVKTKGRSFQYLTLNAIRILDNFYMDKVEQSDQKSGEDSPIEFIRYAYPVMLKKLFFDNNNFDNVAFDPMMPDLFYKMKEVIHNCFTKALSEKFRAEIRYGEYTINHNDETRLSISPKFKYAYLEEFDKINTVVYSHAVQKALQKKYLELGLRL